MTGKKQLKAMAQELDKLRSSTLPSKIAGTGIYKYILLFLTNSSHDRIREDIIGERRRDSSTPE